MVLQNHQDIRFQALFAFDQHHQRVVNMYVLKTDKRYGKLVNTVLDKMGKVARADAWAWWNK